MQCTKAKKGVCQGSIATNRPSVRRTRAVSESVCARSSGSFLRWCKPPCTITMSIEALPKGRSLQSQTYNWAGPVYFETSEADQSAPLTRVKPSLVSAWSPLPRPQKSSRISAALCHLAAPTLARRRVNLRISCDGVSNLVYAVSHGSRSHDRSGDDLE